MDKVHIMYDLHRTRRQIPRSLPRLHHGIPFVPQERILRTWIRTVSPDDKSKPTIISTVRKCDDQATKQQSTEKPSEEQAAQDSRDSERLLAILPFPPATKPSPFVSTQSAIVSTPSVTTTSATSSNNLSTASSISSLLSSITAVSDSSSSSSQPASIVPVTSTSVDMSHRFGTVLVNNDSASSGPQGHTTHDRQRVTTTISTTTTTTTTTKRITKAITKFSNLLRNRKNRRTSVHWRPNQTVAVLPSGISLRTTSKSPPPLSSPNDRKSIQTANVLSASFDDEKAVVNIDDENTSGTTAESLLGIPVTRTRQRLHIDRVRKSCWLNLLDAVDEPQQRFNYVRNFWQHNEISDTLAEFEPMVVKTRSDDANSHIRAEMKRIRKHLGSVVLEQDDDADEDDGDEDDDDDGDRDIEKIGKIDEKTKQGFSEGLSADCATNQPDDLDLEPNRSVVSNINATCKDWKKLSKLSTTPWYRNGKTIIRNRWRKMMRGSSFNDENLTAMKRIDSVSTTAATANNTITPNGNKLNNERNINVGQRTFYYRFNEFDVHDTK